MVKLVVAPHGKALLVTGDTRGAKDDLKELSGRWNGSLGGWIFPLTKRDNVVAELRKKHEVVEGQAEASSGAPPASSTTKEDVPPSVGANASLTVAPHKKAILISGDTKPVKDTLKALGGSWNGTLKGWVFPGSKRDEVVGVLRKDKTNTVTVHVQQPAAEEPNAAPATAPKQEGPPPPKAGEAAQPAKASAVVQKEGKKKRRPWHTEDGEIDLERKMRAHMSGEYKRLKAKDPHSSDSESDDYGPLNYNFHGMG